MGDNLTAFDIVKDELLIDVRQEGGQSADPAGTTHSAGWPVTNAQRRLGLIPLFRCISADVTSLLNVEASKP